MAVSALVWDVLSPRHHIIKTCGYQSLNYKKINSFKKMETDWYLM